MHVWGQFGVIVGPRAHIKAFTELGAKSLLIPDGIMMGIKNARYFPQFRLCMHTFCALEA